MVRIRDLPEKAVEKLHGLEEVFRPEGQDGFITGDNEPVRTEFLGIDLLTLGYASRIERSDHYLARGKSAVQGECNQASLRMEIPEGTTHYCLGPREHVEWISQGKGAYADVKDHIAVAFLKKRD